MNNTDLQWLGIVIGVIFLSFLLIKGYQRVVGRIKKKQAYAHAYSRGNARLRERKNRQRKQKHDTVRRSVGTLRGGGY